jgi:restriction system protein
MFEGKSTLWVVHIGKDDKIALRARNEGFVCIGWTKLGDLSKYPTRQAMKEAMHLTWPNWKDSTVNASYGQVYRFAHEMQIGDPIVFPIRQTREIAIGAIAGEYRFAADSDLQELDYGNVRKVSWIKIVARTLFSKAALHSFGSFTSVSTSDDHLEEVIAIAKGEVFSGATVVTPDTEDDTGDAEDEEGLNLYEAAIQETEDFLLKAWIRSGAAFEHVVAAVLEAIGYTATVTPASGDHGVDIIAHPDPLGLEQPFIKVQVKSGTSQVGEPELNQLIGSLFENERGLFVSLGGFSTSAKAKARNSAKITLIDAKRFVALFLDHYDRLAPNWRAKFPLSPVYVPQR